MTKLLTTNTKLAKSNGTGYLVVGMFLAPHNLSGHQVCPDAGLCARFCVIWYAGFHVMPNVRDAMQWRTDLLFNNPDRFNRQLVYELDVWKERAEKEGLILLIRLNGGSDLDWSWLVKQYPEILFYDYTRVVSRLDQVRHGTWPENYQLTYSISERSNWGKVNTWLRSGHNAAIIFNTAYTPTHGIYGDLPGSWWIGSQDDGQVWPIVDGDQDDNRLIETDGSGVLVGLRFKGPRKDLDFAIDRGLVMDENDWRGSCWAPEIGQAVSSKRAGQDVNDVLQACRDSGDDYTLGAVLSLVGQDVSQDPGQVIDAGPLLLDDQDVGISPNLVSQDVGQDVDWKCSNGTPCPAGQDVSQDPGQA